MLARLEDTLTGRLPCYTKLAVAALLPELPHLLEIVMIPPPSQVSPNQVMDERGKSRWKKAYREAAKLQAMMAMGKLRPPAGKGLFYHAVVHLVVPKWSHKGLENYRQGLPASIARHLGTWKPYYGRDTDNIRAAFKAAQDGFTDALLWRDDSCKHVTSGLTEVCPLKPAEAMDLKLGSPPYIALIQGVMSEPNLLFAEELVESEIAEGTPWKKWQNALKT